MDGRSIRIIDETETNLINLRKTMYLSIMSGLDFEETGHKLLKMKVKPGEEMELCTMLLECCTQERTYLRYYGLLAQRLCMINKVYQECFHRCFLDLYSVVHRLETNKLRNAASFFAHLLATFALPSNVLSCVRLTEEDTNSSSRIFLKFLFQQLSQEHLGTRSLNQCFESIFQKDSLRNTRFAINFFTAIGLGDLTKNARQYLKMQHQKDGECDEERTRKKRRRRRRN